MDKGVNSMIKCIATDMDGTLLDSVSKKITSENRQAIVDAQAQGIEVVISTGRSYEEVNYLLAEAKIECPLILVNGAETRSKDGEISSTNPLTKGQVLDVAKILSDNGIYFEVYTDQGKFTHDREKSVEVILNIVASANDEANVEEAKKYARERAKRIKEIASYDQLFDNKVYKFLVFSFDDNQLAQAAKSLEGVADIAVSSSGHGNMEITHIHAQKGIALERFVASRGISLEETMAVGDSYNDVSMFERVGRAVAMGNADDLIKEKCDFVTAPNDESGVAKAIWEVLKLERV
jgi:Cof subfamily protein (haloacid dehalogenase superfamily)